MKLFSLLGKLFVWQQSIISCRALSPVPSAGSVSIKQPRPIEELQHLTKTITRKVPGSLQYQKTWITWSTLAIEHIRYDFSRRLPHPADRTATRALEHELALVGDTGVVQPSLFGDPGSRSGYALDFFGRVRRLADTVLFVRQQQDDEVVVKLIQDALLQLLSTSEDRRGGVDGSYECRVASIGGGPGYDYVGLCLVATFLSFSTGQRGFPIQVTVFDNEVGWSDLVECMEQSTNRIMRQLHSEGNSCSFGGGCDITKGMDDSVNHRFRDVIAVSKIIICQYCIAENAVALRESAFIFFRELFARANEGTIFVFTETTHRLWPDLVDQLATGFEVAFVKNRSFQLLIRKRRDAGVSPEVRERCLSMMQDVILHSVKRQEGYTRQRKESRQTS